MNLCSRCKHYLRYTYIHILESFKALKTKYSCLKERHLKSNNYQDYPLGGNVQLYWWHLSENSENLGDYLSKVVTSSLMPRKPKSAHTAPSHTLYAIGSILGFRCQDAVVWGSGLLEPIPQYRYRLKLSALDIRAVRGPKTRQFLLDAGHKCPAIYGDPAILMPRIYKPAKLEKKYDVSFIPHFSNDSACPHPIHQINIVTTNYTEFIDQIVQSSLVISTSLHGIILSESYGVPAILLLQKNKSTFKYEDWYHSTNRYNIVVAHSIEEALALTPMPLPNLQKMQDRLIQAFPSDLWN